MPAARLHGPTLAAKWAEPHSTARMLNAPDPVLQRGNTCGLFTCSLCPRGVGMGARRMEAYTSRRWEGARVVCMRGTGCPDIWRKLSGHVIFGGQCSSGREPPVLGAPDGPLKHSPGMTRNGLTRVPWRSRATCAVSRCQSMVWSAGRRCAARMRDA